MGIAIRLVLSGVLLLPLILLVDGKTRFKRQNSAPTFVNSTGSPVTTYSFCLASNALTPPATVGTVLTNYGSGNGVAFSLASGSGVGIGTVTGTITLTNPFTVASQLIVASASVNGKANIIVVTITVCSGTTTTAATTTAAATGAPVFSQASYPFTVACTAGSTIGTVSATPATGVTFAIPAAYATYISIASQSVGSAQIKLVAVPPSSSYSFTVTATNTVSTTTVPALVSCSAVPTTTASSITGSTLVTFGTTNNTATIPTGNGGATATTTIFANSQFGPITYTTNSTAFTINPMIGLIAVGPSAVAASSTTPYLVYVTATDAHGNASTALVKVTVTTSGTVAAASTTTPAPFTGTTTPFVPTGPAIDYG